MVETRLGLVKLEQALLRCGCIVCVRVGVPLASHQDVVKALSCIQPSSFYKSKTRNLRGLEKKVCFKPEFIRLTKIEPQPFNR